METMDSFEQWKEFLSRNVNLAREAGMSQGAMVDAATRIGEFLARSVDPKNREQRLLSEMWKVADDEEKRAIASTITKMVGDGTRH